MALTKKRRNFRSIVVADQPYRWRFTSKNTGFLTVVQESGGGQRLVVALPEWQDPWLHVGNELRPNDPARITPVFAEQAIRRALELGWQPAAAGSTFELEFVNGRFRVSGSRTEANPSERAAAPWLL
ncbi:hypothetical protein [Deinococcus aestuarii]|uniref:hypothetical protein n=1 Tax=Deinococcus aestuarii TaxID=2774531 RepID=UPI001C0BC7CC|nr:hypothetical protein [Deinococcus aestuarii]